MLAYANPSLEPKLIGLFDKLENSSDKADQYIQLSEILRLYGQEVTDGNVEALDFQTIKDQICKIVTIREIPGSKCADGTETPAETIEPVKTDQSTTTNSSSSGG